MDPFEASYRTLFETFGYPLGDRHSLPPAVLDAAEERLGIRVPAALRAYCRVAGRERRFNTAHNRLLPPSRWSVDRKRLIFMEENQGVAWWGVSIRNPEADDPPVWQGINDEPIGWHREHRRCSSFLAVMLHYQAVCGGLPFCGGGDAPEQTDYRFRDHGWADHGQAGSVLAYSRCHQVVCLMPPGDLPFLQKWTVLAGGKTRRDLQTIAGELGVSLR